MTNCQSLDHHVSYGYILVDTCSWHTGACSVTACRVLTHTISLLLVQMFDFSVMASVYFTQTDLRLTIPVTAHPHSKIIKTYVMANDIMYAHSPISCHVAHAWIKNDGYNKMPGRARLEEMFEITGGWLQTTQWLNTSAAFKSGRRIVLVTSNLNQLVTKPYSMQWYYMKRAIDGRYKVWK